MPTRSNGAAVSRIVVDPNNPNLFYAATSNQAVNAPNGVKAGVWRYDGSTWTNLTAIVSDVRKNGSAAGSLPGVPKTSRTRPRRRPTPARPARTTIGASGSARITSTPTCNS